MPFEKGHKTFKGCEKGWFRKKQIPWNKGLTGIHSEESLRKNREAHLGKHPMSAFKKGRIPWNKGLKGVQEAWSKGKTNIFSEKTLKKMSERKKGQHLSPATEFKKGQMTGTNNPNWKGGLVERICETCGKIFFTTQCKVKVGWGKFCSNKCHGKWLHINKSRKNSPYWKGGISFEPYTPDFNQQLKDRIRVRDNFICQLCGVPELECNERLSIHHIDYNKKNCEEWNFISLCRSCNGKVNYNREHWTNYFQQKIGVI